MSGYDLFVSQMDDAIVAFPGLHKTEANNKSILKGTLQVVDKNGKHWEDYEVEIHASEKFPHQFPMLYETSDKIPKIADWHVYEDSFSCCVKILPEEILRCKNGITLVEYIKEEALPYLFNQTHRRVEGYYVNGEYGHGLMGIYEYYSEILKTENVRRTVELIKYIATHNRPFRTSQCFCGRKIKFRHCHREAYDKLKYIGDSILINHAYEIAKAAKLL